MTRKHSRNGGIGYVVGLRSVQQLEKATGRSFHAPTQLLHVLIHPRSCKVRSAKFACRIVHRSHSEMRGWLLGPCTLREGDLHVVLVHKDPRK